VELLLCALMTRTVGRGEQLRPQGRRQGNKHMAAVHDEPVHHGPGSNGHATRRLSTFLKSSKMANSGEDSASACTSCVLVTARQRVCGRVLAHMPVNLGNV